MKKLRMLLYGMLIVANTIGGMERENNALIQAFGNGSSIDFEAVKLLLEKGANPNIKDTEAKNLKEQDKKYKIGIAPLHHAVSHGREDLVDLLLKKKANPNLPITANKNTALILAVCLEEKLKNRNIIKKLLENGANPDIKNDVGQSARTIDAKLIEELQKEIKNT